MPTVPAQISAFIKDASDAAHSLKPVVARLDKVLATGEQTLKAIDPKQIKAITGNIAGASSNLKSFSAGGLRQYEQLAVDARKAVDTLDQAVRSIERDPSQFIWGPSQQEAGSRSLIGWRSSSLRIFAASSLARQLSRYCRRDPGSAQISGET